jgi:hypothetical protein
MQFEPFWMLTQKLHVPRSNVTYWIDHVDHEISGTVYSTEMERMMDEVRAEFKQNAAEAAARRTKAHQPDGPAGAA